MRHMQIACLVAILLAAGSAVADRPEIGESAPDFTLPVTNMEGKKRISLSSHILAQQGEEDRLVVLSFFSMSCKPCKRELSYFDKLVAALGGKLRVYVIDIDKEDEEIEALKAFLEERRIGLPVLLDRYQIVGRRYQVDTLPSCFFLDGKGQVVKVSAGYDKSIKDLIANVIRAVLKVDPPRIEMDTEGSAQGSAEAAEAEAGSKDKVRSKKKGKRKEKARGKKKGKKKGKGKKSAEK